MKLALSYFYQIRFFKPYMIPVSICLSDPPWFHDYQGKNYNFIDKRGVINGLRCENIVPKDIEADCPCERHKVSSRGCRFLKEYGERLESFDLAGFLKTAEVAAQSIKELLKFEEEPIIVLIVYEAPSNPCSERGPLLRYFKKHSFIPCKELKYPIKENY